MGLYVIFKIIILEFEQDFLILYGTYNWVLLVWKKNIIILFFQLFRFFNFNALLTNFHFRCVTTHGKGKKRLIKIIFGFNKMKK
jgi:hypothetical protein